MICGSFVLIGCSDNHATTQPMTMEQKQEALLRDPFSYKNDQNVDISGGKINELDRNALKKDLNHVFNP